MSLRSDDIKFRGRIRHRGSHGEKQVGSGFWIILGILRHSDIPLQPTEVFSGRRPGFSGISESRTLSYHLNVPGPPTSPFHASILSVRKRRHPSAFPRWIRQVRDQCGELLLLSQPFLFSCFWWKKKQKESSDSSCSLWFFSATAHLFLRFTPLFSSSFSIHWSHGLL